MGEHDPRVSIALLAVAQAIDHLDELTTAELDLLHELGRDLQVCVEEEWVRRDS